MISTPRRLILAWIVGSLVGTAVIAITSPLFVRSYVPLTADPVRGVWTLPEGHAYRWRSEGYADTRIGPLGMPGKTSLGPRKPDCLRVALWGDSQAEGVCVGDHQKIFAQAEGLRDGGVAVGAGIFQGLLGQVEGRFGLVEELLADLALDEPRVGLVALGIARVLASGGAATALEGSDALARLVDHAAGRIGVVVGGGVRAEHVAELVRRTGAREVHSSLGGAGTPDVAAVRRMVTCLAARD